MPFQNLQNLTQSQNVKVELLETEGKDRVTLLND